MDNVGIPGAPIAHFSFVVVPSQGNVNGTVCITQSIAPPNGNIVIKNVSGKIRATGFGSITQIVYVTGTYLVTFPPPAIGCYIANFDAHFAIDNKWNGKGGFSYGNNDVENVPVVKVS
jgi:Domain of unknown function (DUF1842)